MVEKRHRLTDMPGVNAVLFYVRHITVATEVYLFGVRAFPDTPMPRRLGTGYLSFPLARHTSARVAVTAAPASGYDPEIVEVGHETSSRRAR